MKLQKCAYAIAVISGKIIAKWGLLCNACGKIVKYLSPFFHFFFLKYACNTIFDLVFQFRKQNGKKIQSQNPIILPKSYSNENKEENKGWIIGLGCLAFNHDWCVCAVPHPSTPKIRL